MRLKLGFGICNFTISIVVTEIWKETNAFGLFTFQNVHFRSYTRYLALSCKFTVTATNETEFLSYIIQQSYFTEAANWDCLSIIVKYDGRNSTIDTLSRR